MCACEYAYRIRKCVLKWSADDPCLLCVQLRKLNPFGNIHPGELCDEQCKNEFLAKKSRVATHTDS